MKLAIVGATGMVGSVMLKVLEERNLPFSELLLVASERNIGKDIQFKGKNISIIGLTDALEIRPNITNLAKKASYFRHRKQATFFFIERS